jgi:DNA-binding IclR family transcriptional regulator
MGTVSKALSLLTLFNHARPAIGLSDFTRLSAMNKATVYRLLAELQAAGFVEQVGGDRAYRLGPEVLRLEALREAAVPILSASRAVLDDLCAATGETAHMSLVRGDQLHTLIHAYSPRHATRVMMDDTEEISFHGTGSGLAVLAFAAPEFTGRILSRPLAAHTGLTLTDPAAIRSVLDEVRATGIAESVGGFEADVHSHAAPIFGADKYPIGALAVAAPVSRMTPAARQAIRAGLKRGARSLTQRTGGFCPPTYPQEETA